MSGVQGTGDDLVTRRVEPDGEKADVRKQIVCTPRWAKRIDQWRGAQWPIPTWSEAVRQLVEEALDAREEASTARPSKPSPAEG